MFKSFTVYLLFITIISSSHIRAQDVFLLKRANWLSVSEKSIPTLKEVEKKPIRIVTLQQDNHAFQGWKAITGGTLDSLYRESFIKRKTVILDFGEHLTGYFSMEVDTTKVTPDAPLRFKITFGEVPAEIATPYDPYPGRLSRAWLQDETTSVMEIPSTVKIARRVAFRYVKIELIENSRYYDFKLKGIKCNAVTSAVNAPAPLKEGTTNLIKNIDRVGLNTLKECMQTVYEDGPKRDRRLWIGDLMLESLANNFSFKNYQLTKRCLYLLAGLSDNNGYLFGTVFEKPSPHPQARQYLMDYALLYNVILKDYLAASGDTQTAKDLWPIAKQQLNIIRSYLQTDNLLDYKKAEKEWWIFFDWKKDLHREAALHGLAIYCIKNTLELAKLLNKENELKDFQPILNNMKKAARHAFFNPKTGLIESGNHQISYASQIWMVLGGVLSSTEGRKSLSTVTKDSMAVYPGTPYLYHYLIQSLIDVGMTKEARATLEKYWGDMVNKGADTFWEVYDPNDEYLSPYKFFPLNSYCHAWSCTPVYFIRKYPEIFQKL